MFPILLKIGPIVIHSYGLLVAMGFLIGINLALRRARKENISEEIILDLAFYILISAILGARLLEVLLNFSNYSSDLLSVFKIWEGGLSYYGGLITTIVVLILLLRKRKLAGWKIGDIFAPSIALGHAIGRLGCFTAGCCYGKPTKLPWGVTFSNIHSLAPLGISLHPTQLYSSLANFVIFLVLLKIYKQKKFDGQIFWIYIIIYSVSRFLIEFLRDDPRGVMIFSIFSPMQLISTILLIIGIIMFNKLSMRSN